MLVKNMEFRVNRLLYIDIAKGVGIILVVCSHTVYPQLMYFANLFFIPLFFVLSGYTYHSTSLKRRTIRLLKPYFIFNIMIISLVYISHIKAVSWNHFLGVVYSRYALFPLTEGNENLILMNVGNSPTWFLTCMYISFILLYVILQAKRNRIWVLVFFLGITYLFSQLSILLPWSLDVSFLMSICMYFGILLRHNKRWIHLQNKYIIALTVLYSILLYLNGYCNLSVRNYGNSVLLYLLGGLIGSYLIVRLSIWSERTLLKKILVPIGQNSLTIFCLQIPLLLIAQKFFGPIISKFSESPNSFLLAIIQIIFTICVGYILSRIINRFFPFIIRA